MVNDDLIVFANCRNAQAEGKEIDDATARVIASWYVDGRHTSTIVFTSTGAITDPTELWRDVVNGGRPLGEPDLYEQADSDHKLALDMLGTYLLNRKDRGPVPGWSDLWVR